MQIQINTDHTIEGHDALSTHILSVVETTLSHVASHLTRVEVHVTDENGAKTVGNDKRCVMEARIEGRTPIAVTHHGANVHYAVNGAADKLARLIGDTLGRFEQERRHRNDPDVPEGAPAAHA
jgi:ribosome-associated translation inhibitor RaiA